MVEVRRDSDILTALLQDMRYGLRVLWGSPGFSSVAVLSLALGVGANTAIFSIVNAVLLRSLPFSHPERLVKIVASNRGVGARDIGVSVPEFDDGATVARDWSAYGFGSHALDQREPDRRLASRELELETRRQ
jgi:putative ABC transport system permease protein